MNSKKDLAITLPSKKATFNAGDCNNCSFYIDKECDLDLTKDTCSDYMMLAQSIILGI